MKSLLTKTALILMVLVICKTAISQNKWVVDKVHSKIGFSVEHMKISTVEGNFKEYEGTILSSKTDFTDSKINFTVEVASINTDNDMRDTHLKSADFFDAAKYTKMTFKSDSLIKLEGNKYECVGFLTIRSTTMHVKFYVIYGGTITDSYGKIRAGFKATTTLNRFDYGLSWNKLIESGEFIVGKDVTVNLNLEFVEQK